MCAVRFLRLEDILYKPNHNHEFILEPQGVLHAKVHTPDHSGLIPSVPITQCKHILIIIWYWDFFKPETKPLMDFLFWMLQLRFFDSFVERQPRLRRQRCIFTKERGRDGLFYLFSCLFLSSMVGQAEIIHRLFFMCCIPQMTPQEKTSSELLRWIWILPHGVTWWWASYLATARSRHSARPSPRPLTSLPPAPHIPLWRRIKPQLHYQGWSQLMHLETPERVCQSLKLPYFGCFAAMLQFSDSALKKIGPLPPAQETTPPPSSPRQQTNPQPSLSTTWWTEEWQNFNSSLVNCRNHNANALTVITSSFADILKQQGRRWRSACIHSKVHNCSSALLLISATEE